MLSSKETVNRALLADAMPLPPQNEEELQKYADQQAERVVGFFRQWRFVMEPSPGWLMAMEVLGNENRDALIFKHYPLKDSQGRDVIANLSVVAERISKDMNAVEYSLKCRMGSPFEVVKVLGPHKSGYGVGYMGRYQDALGSHEILAWHLVKNGIGYQIIADATKEVFPKIEKEATAAMETFQLNE